MTEETQRRLIIGLQPVREAIRAHGAALESVLVAAASGPQLEALARFARDQGARVERVERGALDRLARGARHQGACAWAPALRLVDLDDLVIDATSLLLVLDELEDPQNFGAVIRSAVGLGATAVIWPEHHAAPLSPATFRASAGAVEHATLCRVTGLPTALAKLRERGVTILGLDASASDTLEGSVLGGPGVGPLALVVGSEGRGLRGPVKRACDRLARLPMSRAIDSLNASVAVAIALYEAGRQRRAAGAPEVAQESSSDGGSSDPSSSDRLPMDEGDEEG